MTHLPDRLPTGPIVIAEPNQGIREGLETFPFGEIRPVIVGTYKGLVSTIRTGIPPSIIVSETWFPEKQDSPDGSLRSVLTYMQNHRLNSPVVILTSRYLNPEDAQEDLGKFDNVKEIHIKPVSPTQLIQIINRVRL